MSQAYQSLMIQDYLSLMLQNSLKILFQMMKMKINNWRIQIVISFKKQSKRGKSRKGGNSRRKTKWTSPRGKFQNRLKRRWLKNQSKFKRR